MDAKNKSSQVFGKDVKHYFPPESAIVDANATICGVATFDSWEWNAVSLAKVRSHIPNYKIEWLKAFGKDLCFGDSRKLVRSIMEFAYARLENPIEGELPAEFSTAKNDVYSLKYFVLWMLDNKITKFSDVGKGEIDDFVRHGVSESFEGTISEQRFSRILSTLYLYGRYRNRVSEKLPSKVVQYLKRMAAKKFGKKASSTIGKENKTDPIPEPVLKPLLSFSIKLVYTCWPDIKAARQRVFEIKREVISSTDLSDSGRRKNISRKVRKMLASQTISPDPDTGQPWREAWSSVGELIRDELAVYQACLALVLFLSGMRAAEVENIRTGAALVERSRDGVILRYHIKSRLTKNADRKETWTTIKTAYDALMVAQELAEPLRGFLGSDHVFIEKTRPQSLFKGAPLALCPMDDDYQGAPKKTGNKSFGRGTANRYLDGLSAYINKRFFGLDGLLPDAEGLPYHLTTRQFRRTLARYIARQPFGIIAGMIQYKHANTAIFEGYAGNDPSWRTLLEEEKELASIDFLKEVYFDIQEGRVGGPKGQQLINDMELVFEDFQGQAGDKRKDGLKYWLDNQRKNLHVGLLNYCFYDPDKALCTAGKANNDNPVLNRCNPGLCENSCVGTRHIPVWEHQVQDIDDLLAGDVLSEPQRIILEREKSEAVQVISSVKSVGR